MDSRSIKKYSFWLIIKSLPILEIASPHNTINAKEKLKGSVTAIRMIPTGLTLKLQPLNISTNKVLKQILKNKYVSTALRITNL